MKDTLLCGLYLLQISSFSVWLALFLFMTAFNKRSSHFHKKKYAIFSFRVSVLCVHYLRNLYSKIMKTFSHLFFSRSL